MRLRERRRNGDDIMGNTLETNIPRPALPTSDPPTEASMDGVEPSLDAAPPIQIDRALTRAWSLAVSHPDLWRKEVWPLIFAVETARQEGEADLRAEEELLGITGRLWAFT
jgi:hypothetical protein